MKYPSHLIGSVFFTSATTFVLSNINVLSGNSESALVLGGALIGCLLPDLDHPKSYISNKHPFLSLFTKIFLLVSKLLIKFILLFCFWIKREKKEEILSMFSHRGIYHTFLFAFLFLIPFSHNEFYLLQIGLFLGILSHLFMDVMTISGVPILFPLIMKPMHIPIFKLFTGKFLDEFLGTIFFCGVVILITFIINLFI